MSNKPRVVHRFTAVNGEDGFLYTKTRCGKLWLDYPDMKGHWQWFNNRKITCKTCQRVLGFKKAA